MDLPNVLIVLLHRFVHLHEQAKCGFSGLSCEQNCSLQLPPPSEMDQNSTISFSYFISCEFCVDDAESLEISQWLRGINVEKSKFAKHLFCK